MTPIQVLTNNLLYDFSQTTPTDNVDNEYIAVPRRWDIGNITKFMLFLGPISSIFDYVTYGTLLFVFGACDCAVRGFVSSDAGPGKELPRRPGRMLAEPGSDYVTAAERRGTCCGYRIDHGTGSVLSRHQCGGTVQHQNRTAPGSPIKRLCDR